MRQGLGLLNRHEMGTGGKEVTGSFSITEFRGPEGREAGIELHILGSCSVEVRPPLHSQLLQVRIYNQHHYSTARINIHFTSRNRLYVRIIRSH